MSKALGGSAPRPTEMYVSVPAAPDPNGNRAERRAAKTVRPTRARVGLLVDVANGLVRRSGATAYRSALPAPDRVTGRMAELTAAGWAKCGEDGIYILTESGQELLAEGVR